jgi:hypothetical protein
MFDITDSEFLSEASLISTGLDGQPNVPQSPVDMAINQLVSMRAFQRYAFHGQRWSFRIDVTWSGVGCLQLLSTPIFSCILMHIDTSATHLLGSSCR